MKLSQKKKKISDRNVDKRRKKKMHFKDIGRNQEGYYARILQIFSTH